MKRWSWEFDELPELLMELAVGMKVCANWISQLKLQFVEKPNPATWEVYELVIDCLLAEALTKLYVLLNRDDWRHGTLNVYRKYFIQILN